NLDTTKYEAIKARKKVKIELCSPQVQIVIRSIRNYIQCGNMKDACKQLINLCYFSRNNEKVIYELGMNIIELMPNNFDISAGYHDTFKDICKKEPLKSFLFFREIIMKIKNKTDINEIYLLVNSRLIQQTDNHFESIICGVVEYALYLAQNSNANGFLIKAANHFELY
ncbi:hypothetical protein MXB_4277, partial [Myxobolus squamalis]